LELYIVAAMVTVSGGYSPTNISQVVLRNPTHTFIPQVKAIPTSTMKGSGSLKKARTGSTRKRASPWEIDRSMP